MTLPQPTDSHVATDVRSLPPLQQLLLLRTLQAGFKAAEDDLRQVVNASMAPGDRRFGVGPVAEAKVTKSKPEPTTVVRFTDKRALAEWLVTNYPDRVYPMPDEYVLKDIEALSQRAGEPCGPGGETGIPGVEVVETTPEPEFKVYADRSAAALVTQRWQALVAGMPAELLAGETP